MKMKPWQLLDSEGNVIGSSASPVVQVKIRSADAPAANDFEEVWIDGSDPGTDSASKPSNDIVVYMCSMCKTYFPLKRMLVAHRRTAHGKPCDNVDELPERSSPDTKRIFYVGYHKVKSGQYVCNYCPFRSFARATVSAHANLEHVDLVQSAGDNEIAANSRGKEEPEGESQLKFQALEEDDEDSWPMEVVEEEAPEDNKSESEDASLEKARACPYCSFVTSNCSTFHSHVKRKHCQSYFKSTGKKVRVSSAKKSEPREFSCPRCDYTARKEIILRAHMLRKHDSIDKDRAESKEQRPNELEDEQKVMEEEDAGVVDEELELEENESLEAGKTTTATTRTSSARKSLKCPFCPYETWIRSTMQSHVGRYHRRNYSSTRQRVLQPLTTTTTTTTATTATQSIQRPSNAQLYTGYACNYCTFVAATVASINSHTGREHQGLKQPIKEVPVTEYDCDQCDFKSRNRRNMQLHVKRCHTAQANAEGMFACHACSYETLSRMGLKRHISIKHSKSRSDASLKGNCHECDQCDFKCLNGKTMDWHKRQHSAPPNAEDDGNSYFCNDCDFSTWTKGQLYLHIKRKHQDAEGNNRETELEQTEPVYACEQCDYTSKNKHVMKVHVIRKHTNEYNHECEICGKKYKIKADLTNHIRFQHREQPIICDVCGKTCRNSNLLYLHQKFAHYKPEFECPICHRRMVSQANLDDHILKQHEQREDAVCEECGKKFTKQARLKIHMRIHSGIKPYTCKVCLKAFARRNGLRQHLLIHTGQRPYICDICGKSFTQKTGLICHRKSHPGSHPPLPRVTIDHVLSDLLNEEC